MPLDNRNLKTRTVLRARYKGKERTCEVVQTADGLRYRLDDGREFASPSSAGKAAMGGVSCNGWRFWSIKATGTPKAAKPAKATKEPAAKPTAHGKPAKSKAAPKKSAKTKRAKKGKAMRVATSHATDVHVT